MVKYVFFWREYEVNGIYSQWYLSDFKENEITFNCAEQYMMYHKAMIFGDLCTASKILNSSNPYKIKSLGREVSNFDNEKWNTVRYNIVKQGNMLKFSQDEKLKKRLMKHDSSVIFVEASPYDKIWGVGYKPANALANKNKWGLNLLGKAIADVRNELK